MGADTFELAGEVCLQACLFIEPGAAAEYEGCIIYRHTVGTVWSIRLADATREEVLRIGARVRVYLAKVAGIDRWGVAKHPQRAQRQAEKTPKKLAEAFARAQRLLVTMDAAQRLGAP